MSIRVLLNDDHEIVREGLRTLLEKEPGIDVVAVADNGRTAVQLARDLRPDVAVIDLAMPGMNGFEATRRMIVENPDIRILVLSMHSARRYMVEALAAGAKGYLMKDCTPAEFVGAIRAVAENQTYVSPKLAGVIIKDYLKRFPDTVPAVSSILSSREREVLQLVAEGENTKEIAFTLGLSKKTVETHRQQIMKKLNLFSIAELIRYAIREGLTSVD
jgi:DNA-binding NarL/FixJ family response regulator